MSKHSPKTSRRAWTKAEEKVLVGIARKATSYEQFAATARKALPNHSLSEDAISKKMEQLREPTVRQMIAANNARVQKKDEDGELAKFVTVAKAGKFSLEQLCDRFEKTPKQARAMIEAAKAGGFRIDLVGGHVGYVPPKPLIGETKIPEHPGDENVFGVMSDLHVGSKYCLEDSIIDHATRAHKEDGVRTTFLGGDLLDGCYGHSRWEESFHGFHPQARRLAKILPMLKDHRYVAIAGNHDETFEKESGMDVCQGIEDVFRSEGRDDLRMIGSRGAYVRLGGSKAEGRRGVLVELWHPMGGGAYARSYRLQKHVEGYAVGQKPDFLFTGHWHQQCYVVIRGVHAFSAGTFHGGGGSFGKAIGGSQAIGAWVVRYRQTPKGTLRDVTPTWRAYYEHEQVRELGLG